MARHAEAEYPLECCGIVTRGSDGMLYYRAGENLDDISGLFTLNPQTVIRARLQNEAITGLYHSHCDGPPLLSQMDLRYLVFEGQPLWPNVDVFIASVEGGHCVCVQRFVWSDLKKTYEVDERYQL